MKSGNILAVGVAVIASWLLVSCAQYNPSDEEWNRDRFVLANLSDD